MSAKLVGDGLGAGDEPDAQAARQRLGEAARIDHAIELIERCQPRRRLHLQIAEDVVLHDEEAVAFRGLQNLEADMRAHVAAGRILHHRLGEIDLRTVRGGEFLQRRDIRSVRIARHRQHLHAVEPQVPEHVVIAGIVHQRRVARFEQIADDELERLAGTLRQQDLAGMGGDAEFGEQQGQVLAQRQIAERVAVFEQVGTVLARQHVKALPDAGLVEP